ncbi:MAG: hypothetical protein Q4G23_03350 [Clostridia bacterium]|nr:hypothetical protein [Clostridia bacterium]
MAEYEGKLIRMGNNQSSERLTNNHYMQRELARLRNTVRLWDKLTMRTDGINRFFTGYVIYKNNSMFVLEQKDHGYCEAFQWVDLLVNQKYREKEGS